MEAKASGGHHRALGLPLVMLARLPFRARSYISLRVDVIRSVNLFNLGSAIMMSWASSR